MQVRKWTLSYWQKGMAIQEKRVKWFKSIELLNMFLQENPEVSVRVITRGA